MTDRPNLTTAAALLAVFAVFFWAQADDAQRMGNAPSAASQAAQEEAETIASREWAGQQVCGPRATPEWLDDKTLRCLKHVDQPTRVAGGQR